VKRLQIQLIIRLDRHETHTGTRNGLSNGFRIDVVVLVRLKRTALHTGPA
jgi:hypothetical protein